MRGYSRGDKTGATRSSESPLKAKFRELILLGSRVNGGEARPEDARESESSVRRGWRVLSSYPVGSETGREKVRVTTKADRSSTRPLRSRDY